MGIRHYLKDSHSLKVFNDHARQAILLGKPMTVELISDKRSNQQNRISHAWYNEVATQRGDISPTTAKAYSKRFCGVPILITENEQFRETIARLKAYDMTEEDKIDLFKWFPVTSLMDVKQKSEYLEAVQRYWGRQGVYLAFPDDYERQQYPEAG